MTSKEELQHNESYFFIIIGLIKRENTQRINYSEYQSKGEKNFLSDNVRIQ